MILKFVIYFLLTVSALATDWYVTPAGTGNGTSWESATNSIQGAVDAASAGDTVWLGAGTYALSTQITVSDAMTIRSSNGIPTTVTVSGENTCRVFELCAGAWVIGVTITKGLINTPGVGGAGVLFGSISNCIVTANDSFGGSDVGGVDTITAYNSLIAANSGILSGGAAVSTLYSCTIVNNSGSDHGGVVLSTLWNCIVKDNYPNDISASCTDYYTCATNATGAGSITSDPLFVGGGDYSLQAGSPCVNTGTNQAWMTVAKDIAGDKRIWPSSGTVDMGCYELNSAPPAKYYLFKKP